MTELRPWAYGPFELLQHAEGHFRAGSDFDRRMALISFDNAIEVSIKTFLSLHPSQRYGEEYARDQVEKWQANYHSLLDFFFHYMRGREIKVPREEIIWYHQLRNELYHAQSGGMTPGELHLQGIRKSALWVFEALYEGEPERLLNARLTLPPTAQPAHAGVEGSELSERLHFLRAVLDFEEALQVAHTELPGEPFQAASGSLPESWRGLLARRRRLRRPEFADSENYAALIDQVHVLQTKIVRGELLEVSEKDLAELTARLNDLAGIVNEIGQRRKTGPHAFFAKMPHAAREFFEEVLAQAQARGHSVYWGKVGFSLRVYLPGEDRYVTFAYGWPNGRFEAYTGYLPVPPGAIAALRTELLGFGVFQAVGRNTLRADVTENTSERLSTAYAWLLEYVERLAQPGPTGEPDEPSEREQFYQDYWRAFCDVVREKAPEIPLPTISSKYSQRFRFGRSYALILTAAARRDKKIDVHLALIKDQAKEFFDRLHAERTAIEKELGFPLEWKRDEDMQRSRLEVVKHGADPAQESAWPAQHAWLAEHLIAFYRVLVPRVRALKDSDE